MKTSSETPCSSRRCPAWTYPPLTPLPRLDIPAPAAVDPPGQELLDRTEYVIQRHRLNNQVRWPAWRCLHFKHVQAPQPPPPHRLDKQGAGQTERPEAVHSQVRAV